MKEYSTSQVSIRQKTLSGINAENQFYLLYGSLAMEVFCPSKVRVGTIGDGGKWVCNPWRIPENSVLFSLGLNNIISFEEEWQRMTSNRSVIYGFDVDEQQSNTKDTYAKNRGTTRKAKISNKTDTSRNEYTIEDLAKSSNVSEIEILKIDIEGAEMTCLIPFLKTYNVCQIYLEVHGGSPAHVELLNHIGQLGYRLFSYEVNGYAMTACEYSFIRDACVDKYGALPIANYLDFKKN
ncbi:hypothetical protein GCK72_002903 [Caenorhabditis remanei]|uniref:Methyltransferase domain-containing protein n=1 Tax=Caenorhabditis remanei TaxID=31234 RepID=A0A6A5HT22_CAERE|nr:hypothetical protein GCK72_002903 [Caenorhabditis remanei]KAF1771078.1 hypothetical protein GCK72_002903 [Caenorhabditis remanei]